MSEVEKYAGRDRNSLPIFIAEDSALLMKLISDSLSKAGYANLDISPNGQECWDKLEKLAASIKIK